MTTLAARGGPGGGATFSAAGRTFGAATITLGHNYGGGGGAVNFTVGTLYVTNGSHFDFTQASGPVNISIGAYLFDMSGAAADNTMLSNDGDPFPMAQIEGKGISFTGTPSLTAGSIVTLISNVSAGAFTEQEITSPDGHKYRVFLEGGALMAEYLGEDEIDGGGDEFDDGEDPVTGDKWYKFPLSYDKLKNVLFKKSGDDWTPLDDDDPGRTGTASLSGYRGHNNMGNAKAGSTVVTLYGAFLSSLPAGDYIVGIESVDGTIYESTAIIRIDNKGTVLRSGGSGSSGGSEVQQPAPVVKWLTKPDAQALAKSAKNAEQSFGLTKYNYKFGVRGDAWDKLKGLQYQHDSFGSPVQVRLYIDNPENMQGDILVSAWTKGRDVERIRNLFNRWFDNKVQIVYFDHAGEWGQTLRAAANINLDGMDAENLYFYNYDSKTNRFTRIRKPNYRIDCNGFLHFSMDTGGAVIVSDGALVRRG